MRQVTRNGLLSVAAASGMLALSAGAAYADSDATGSSQNAPGVASGNNVQVPVSVPASVCGNTINVVGILNPAMGNGCANNASGTEDQGNGSATAAGTAQGSPGVASGNEVQAPIDVPVNACGNNVSVVGVGNAVTGNRCADGSGPALPGESGDRLRSEEPGQPLEEPSGPDGSGGEESPGDGEGPEGLPAEAQNAGPEPEGDGVQAGRPDEGETGAGAQAEEEAEAEDEAATAAAGPSEVDAEPDGGQLAQTGAGQDLIGLLPLGAGLLLGGVVLYRRRESRLGRRGC
jgi:LPXTG-motif cell wall-anchored protein